MPTLRAIYEVALHVNTSWGLPDVSNGTPVVQLKGTTRKPENVSMFILLGRKAMNIA